MRNQALKLLVVLLLAQMIVGVCAAQEKPAPRFTLEIISDYYVGYPPISRSLNVKVTNISNEILKLECGKVGGDYDLSVVYDGLRLQEKDAVQAHRKRGELDHCISSMVPPRIKPGALIVSIVDVSKFYDLSKPGEYEITLSKETDPGDPDKSVTVRSNTFSIVVSEAESKAVEADRAEKRAAPPFVLDAEESTVHVGDPIIVGVTRKNTTDTTLFLWNVRNLISWVDFDVRMGSELVPETQNLKDSKSPIAVALALEDGYRTSLEPGETAGSNTHLSDLYDMSKPGVYQVTATLVCSRCGSNNVKSNTITITVLPAGQTLPSDATPAEQQ